MNVLLVDDHALFREGLALLLRPLVDSGEILESGSCEQAMEVLSGRQDVDLVLMDLGLPLLSGLDGIAWVHDVRPGLPVVALSSADDRETVLSALAAGAMGYIPKSSTSAVMLSALQLVLARGIYLPPSAFLGTTAVAPAQVQFHGAGSSVAATPSSVRAETTAADLGLTPRQAEVLDLLLQGKSAKLIGRDLSLSPSTVKSHTSAVLRALNVTTRVQAVIAASRLGWRLRQ